MPPGMLDQALVDRPVGVVLEDMRDIRENTNLDGPSGHTAEDRSRQGHSEEAGGEGHSRSAGPGGGGRSGGIAAAAPDVRSVERQVAEQVR